MIIGQTDSHCSFLLRIIDSPLFFAIPAAEKSVYKRNPCTEHAVQMAPAEVTRKTTEKE
jgi:hypothetical protein